MHLSRMKTFYGAAAPHCETLARRLFAGPPAAAASLGAPVGNRAPYYSPTRRSLSAAAVLEMQPELGYEDAPLLRARGRPLKTLEQEGQYAGRKPVLDEQQEPRVHFTAGTSGFCPSVKAVQAVLDRILTDTPSLLCKHRRPDESGAAHSSFHVLDLAHVTSKAEHWGALLPEVRPFYAVKANPAPQLVQHLSQKHPNFGFDCASPAEIELALDRGASPDRIIFAHPCKAPAAIVYAREAGVTQSVFDSVEELHKVATYAPDMSLLLRIWVDDASAQCQLSNKYGASREEWPELLATARRLGIRVNGVSLHVGSGNTDPSVFGRTLGDARELFRMGEAEGHRMRVLDIGGGFPGSCSADTSLEKIAAMVRPHLARFPAGTRFIAEPGRYMVAEAQTLATMVMGHKRRADRPVYFVADSLYGSFNCIIYDHSRILPDPLETGLSLGAGTEDGQNACLEQSILFGQTCDGIDQISSEVMLPRLRTGDWLIFPGMGAYTNSACSTFNGFSPADLTVVS